MKDMYKTFNEIDIDVAQFEEAQITPFENKLIKKQLRAQVTKSKKWKKKVAAFTLSMGISLAALFGLSFTTFAQDIPILGSIFKLFEDQSIFEKFDHQAKQHQLIAEDQGIKITIKESVFDGTLLYMTYEIESPIDLGESPFLAGMPKSEDFHYWSSTNDIKKISDNHYAGIMTAHAPPSFFDNEIALVDSNFVLKIDSILPDPTMNLDNIKGNWHFNFKASVTDNHTQLVNARTGNDNMTIEIEKITYTPMSFNIYFNELIPKELRIKWDFISSDVEIKDNLGNTYKQGAHHATGNPLPIRASIWNYMVAFEGLDENATSLIITPFIEFQEADGIGEFGNRYRLMNSQAKTEIFELDKIIINVEKP